MHPSRETVRATSITALVVSNSTVTAPPGGSGPAMRAPRRSKSRKSCSDSRDGRVRMTAPSSRMWMLRPATRMAGNASAHQARRMSRTVTALDTGVLDSCATWSRGMSGFVSVEVPMRDRELGFYPCSGITAWLRRARHDDAGG